MIEIKITGNDAAETLQQLKELVGRIESAKETGSTQTDTPRPYVVEQTGAVANVDKNEYAKQLQAINQTEQAHTTTGRLKLSEPEPQTLERTPIDTDAPNESDEPPMALTELRAIVTQAVQAGKGVKALLDSTNYTSVAAIPEDQRRAFAETVQAL